MKSQLTHCTPQPNWTPSPGVSRYPASPGASSPRDHHGDNEPEPVPRANDGNGYLSACFQPGSASLGCPRRRDPASPAAMRAPRSHRRDCRLGVPGRFPEHFLGRIPPFPLHLLNSGLPAAKGPGRCRLEETLGGERVSVHRVSEIPTKSLELH